MVMIEISLELIVIFVLVAFIAGLLTGISKTRPHIWR